MAKHKTTKITIGRSKYDEALYRLWLGHVTMQVSCDDCWKGPAHILFAFCSGEWAALMPSLHLEEGTYRHALIHHLPDGEKITWADEWAYYMTGE